MRILLVDPGAPHSTGDVYRGYVAAFRRAGHDLIEYSVTARYEQASIALDRAWKAAKHRPRPTEADIAYRASEGILSHALRFQPDWVLIVSAMYLHPDFLIYLKRTGLKVGLILTESPYADAHQERLVPFVDVAWTQERASVARLRHANPRVGYLPPAFDPIRHRPEPEANEPDVRAHDVVFVGHGFVERCKLLAGVDWSGIDLGLYGDWRPLNSRSRLRKQAYVKQGIIENAEAVALYRKAKIGLNLFRTGEDYSDVARPVYLPESANPRCVELAACGCFQISEHREEVAELFGWTVPRFETAEQLGHLVRYSLAHDNERALCQSGARQRVADESFDARVGQIEADLAALRPDVRTNGHVRQWAGSSRRNTHASRLAAV